MGMIEEWLKTTLAASPIAPPMNTDTEMAAPWEDDDNWIEDRWTRGETFERKTAGYWAGDARAPTYVLPIGAALSTPPPTFRGFHSAARVTPRVETLPDLAGLGTLPETSSNSGSDRHRDQNREDMLRYHALSSRERFHDEPAWGGRRPRYDPRNSRANDDYREERDREQLEREQQRLRERERRDRHLDRERERELELQARERDAMKMPHWVQRDTRHEISRDNPRDTPREMRRDTARTDARRDEKRREASPPPRLFPLPDPTLAPRDAAGHPLAAQTIARAASDYDGPAAAGAPSATYVAEEEDRVARHLAKDKGKETVNLIEWLEQGEDTAYEKFKFIVQNASALPADFRAEGEAFILSQQQRIEHTWWTTTRGGPRPNRAERISGARNGSIATLARAPAPGISMGRTPNSMAGSSYSRDDDVQMDEDNTAPPTWSFGSVMRAQTPPPELTTIRRPPPRPTMGGFQCDAPGYLGRSAPNAIDLAPAAVADGEFRKWRGLPNTLGTVACNIRTINALLPVITGGTITLLPVTYCDIAEVARHYAFADPSTWTTGIRNTLGTRAKRGGDDVHVGDALAFQTLIALGPADRRNRAHQWRGFFETAIQMLSIPGFYEYIVRVGGYPPASLDAEHFPGPTNNTTIPVVAAWLVRHGIPTTGVAIATLEAFGRSCRNARANIADLDNVGWADDPRSVARAMAVDVASIPSWVELRATMAATPAHAATVVDSTAATGVSPQGAGDGLESSIHAPGMELDDVVPGEYVSTSGVRIITESGPTMPQPLSPPSPPDSDADAETEPATRGNGTSV
ncbi:hypothetical protein C8R47DRAFT_1063056 [Mycena vitilis]|nr:hypothetical protein C8R47DRAFT_1063056 [Mycena vitilis]